MESAISGGFVNPNLSLPAAGTLILHSLGNPSAPTSIGWAQLQGGSAVSAYAIYTQIVAGRQNQDVTALAALTTSRALVPFDNSAGFVTAIALANPGGSSESITVGLQPTSGSSSQLSSIAIPAQGHTSFALPTQFGATSAISGTLEFYNSTGTFAILALRANATGAFAAAPVYSEFGPPIIASSGSGGSFPQFSSSLSAISSQASAEQSGFNVQFTLLNAVGNPAGCVGTAQTVGDATTPIHLTGSVSFASYSVSGLSVTCTGLNVANTIMTNSTTGVQAPITSASVTFTLSPQTSFSGSVSGVVNLLSTVGTISASFNGSYAAQ